MVRKKGSKFLVLLICILIVFVLLGGIGSFFTSKNTGSEWYNSIKPSITPPSWVFPVVWNFLFVLISFSLYFAWINAKTKQSKRKVIIVFGINFILNILWSILFFGLKETSFAFVEILLLWVSTLAIILVVKKISKKSAWLIIPYLIWLSFATILNGIIVFVN